MYVIYLLRCVYVCVSAVLNVLAGGNVDGAGHTNSTVDRTAAAAGIRLVTDVLCCQKRCSFVATFFFKKSFT